MIIIKIIILYFIQIRHTDDFPSTGTRLVSVMNWRSVTSAMLVTLTTNLAAVVCVDVCQCAQFDQILPARSHFESKRPENCVRIAKFPYAAFGPLLAFHCPLFFTRNNDLEWKSSHFAAVVRRSVADKQLA